MIDISKNFQEINSVIKFDKPLVIFDFETTGKKLSEDRIVKIAYTKIKENGIEKRDNIILNPEIEISPEALTVHGIHNEDLKDSPTFKDLRQEIWQIFNNCYYSGFNVMEFDLPMLKREFLRVGMDFDYKKNQIIDVKKVFNFMVPRTVLSAYKYYCGGDLKDSHRNYHIPDIIQEILLNQFKEYKEVCDWNLLETIHNIDEELCGDNSMKFYWKDGDAYFAFSHYKDRRLKDIVKEDPNFLKWMLTADFSQETKSIIKVVLQKNNLI